MQMICQQQGVSTVPGPLLESAAGNSAGSSIGSSAGTVSNRPNANEFRPAPRKPASRPGSRLRNPYRRGKRGGVSGATLLKLQSIETRLDTRHKMRIVCVLFTFENNWGRTDGRTHGRTDERTDTPSYRGATAH